MVPPRRLGTVLLLIAGALRVSGAAAAQEPSCPTTASFSPPKFILPAPYDALPQPPKGSFWYGTQALWTRLSSDGHFGGLYREDLHAYRNKLTVWRPGIDWRANPQPAVMVTARRLDGKAPAVTIPPATAISTSRTPETRVLGEEVDAAMMTGVDLPTAGCWEFTARYAADSLTFIVSVP